MAGPHRLREMVSETVRDVVRSEDLSDALGRLSHHFQEEYDLWRASIVELLPTRRIRVIAVWSVGEPTIIPDMEVPFNLTPALESLVESLMSGRAMLLDPATAGLGLVSDVYRREGVRSWLCIPLRDDGSFRAVLNLASTTEGIFEPADIGLFSALAVGIERHMLALAGVQ